MIARLGKRVCEREGQREKESEIESARFRGRENVRKKVRKRVGVMERVRAEKVITFAVPCQHIFEGLYLR